MKTIFSISFRFLAISATLGSIILVSCVIPPIGLLNFQENAGMPSTNEEGKFEDTPSNRKFFLEAYADLVKKEASGQFPEADWEKEWRMRIKAIKKNTENPNWEIDSIRKLRRDAGLPVWNFMY